MAWFDGTFNMSCSDFEENYPNVVTGQFRLSDDGKRLAIINDLEEGHPYFSVSEPPENQEEPFFCIVSGEEAEAVQEMLEAFFKQGYIRERHNISLFRYEEGRYLDYSDGFVCRDLMKDQKALRETLADKVMLPEDCFIVPLKCYLYRCRVCGIRCIHRKSFFEICPNCRWEDGGIMGEMVNHCDMNTYRKIYYRCIDMGMEAGERPLNWYFDRVRKTKGKNPNRASRKRKHRKHLEKMKQIETM